jgi:hypothetical protein
MLGRLSAGLVIALVSFSTAAQDATAAETKQTQAKTTTTKVAAKATTKRHAKRLIAHRGRGKSYLVPPPPPYAPSILPELAYSRYRGHRKSTTVATQAPEEKKSTYESLGVQAVEGYEDPEPVKKGNGVVTWNNKG